MFPEDNDVIFKLTVDDAQLMANERMGRDLDADELRSVKKMVEFGLDSWAEVLSVAIDEVKSEAAAVGTGNDGSVTNAPAP